MTVTTILRKVRDEVLTSEDRWIKGTTAVDALGLFAPSRSDRACRWCLYGALRRATETDSASESAYHALKIDGIGSPIEWNDAPERTFADVRGLLDRAIDASEARNASLA